MKKTILKGMMLMGLLAIMQSCSKENDLPISKEKTIAQQTASQKLASSIRVISVNKPIASLTLDGTVGLDLDNNLTDDLILAVLLMVYMLNLI
jgi:hypothetical protein